MKKESTKNLLLLFGACILFLILELPCIVDVRPVMVDEAWYGNTAYNLAHGHGFINTIVGNGGNANFVAPTIMAGVMLIFGDSLLAIRLAAVLCGVLTLVVLHLIMNKMQCVVWSRIIGYGLFVGITLMNSIFRYGRPEFASIFFTATGIYAFLRYYDNKTWGNMVLLSVATFLATCSHPYSILLFALLGGFLLINILKNKQQGKCWWHLGILLLCAISALVIIPMVSLKYNLIPTTSQHATTMYSKRLLGSDILGSLMLYVKEIFLGKHMLVTIPGVLLLIWTICKSRIESIQILALTMGLFLMIFPILFAADKNMLGNAAGYYVIVLIILAMSALNEMNISALSKKRKLVVHYILLIYCVMLGTITVYFNFFIRYENVNTTLTRDLNEIIPDNALVFGPIRQWPCKMNCRYYSDHVRYKTLPLPFEYIITNEQDKNVYGIYESIMKDMARYEIVYQRKTKQYGEVVVYKLIDK